MVREHTAIDIDAPLTAVLCGWTRLSIVLDGMLVDHTCLIGAIYWVLLTWCLVGLHADGVGIT